MNSVYKWKITVSNEVYYAYLLDDGNEGVNGVPFILKASTSQRKYNGQDWTPSGGSAVDEQKISQYVSYISTESTYKAKYGGLLTLVSNTLGTTGEMLPTANSGVYYNIDFSSCGDAGQNSGCPILTFKYVSIESNETGGAVITNSGVTNGVNWYEVTLYVPKGVQGEQGERGDNGEDGKDGKDGTQGPAGPKGDQGIQGSAGKGRNVMAFRVIAKGSERPATPTGGTYNNATGDITYPSGWGDNNNCSSAFTNGCDIWMSCGDFSVEGETPSIMIPSNWTDPVKINGEDGNNGTDGDFIQFMYFNSAVIYDTQDFSIPVGEQEDQPDVVVNGNVVGKWADHPVGISQDFPIEYMTTRTRADSTQENWGDWSQPAIWAKWGEDGIDGDGVEYIFKITQTRSDDVKGQLKDELDTYFNYMASGTPEEQAIWNKPDLFDYFREQGMLDEKGTYHGWTDDPSDVGPGEPFEWAGVRRSKWDDTNKKSYFNTFPEPTLWAKWATTPIVFDLSQESVGIGTGDDWVLDITESVQITTLLTATNARITDVECEFIGGIYDKCSVDWDNVPGVGCTITVTLQNGFNFFYLDGHRLDVEITATAIAEDGEESAGIVVFSISAAQGGKEGKLVKIQTSESYILHDLENDTFIPSFLDACVDYGGETLTENILWEYTLKDTTTTANTSSITISDFDSYYLSEEAIKLYLKANVNGTLNLFADVPILPSGKSTPVLQLDDNAFMIGTGTDDILDLENGNTVSMETEYSLRYGNRACNINSCMVSKLVVKRGEINIASFEYNGTGYDIENEGCTASTTNGIFTLKLSDTKDEKTYNSQIDLQFSNSTASTVNGNLYVTLYDKLVLTNDFNFLITISGEYGVVACEATSTFKVIGVENGVDGHSFQIKANPDEFSSNQDHSKYFASATTLTVFESSREDTMLTGGTYEYIGYDINNFRITEEQGNTFNVSSEGETEINVGEYNASSNPNGLKYATGKHPKDLERLYIEYTPDDDTPLYDSITLYVNEKNGNIPSAGFVDDTWFLYTGENDFIYHGSQTSHTAILEVYYGAIKITPSSVSLKSGNVEHLTIGEYDPSTSGITFTANEGLDLTSSIDVVFTISGKGTDEISYIINATYKILGLEPGESPIIYELEVDCSSVNLMLAGITSPSTINAKVYRVKGNNRTEYTDGTLKANTCKKDGTVVAALTVNNRTINTNGVTDAAELVSITWSGDSVTKTVNIPVTSEYIGKMQYAAGIWESGKTYQSTDTATPFVYYEPNEKYYYLATDQSRNDVPTADTSATIWKKMDDFDTVIAKAVMADRGTFDKAVFYKGFMYSQDGKDMPDGTDSSNYENFLTPDGSFNTDDKRTVLNILNNSSFVPNYFVNLKTGEEYNKSSYGAARDITKFITNGFIINDYTNTYFFTASRGSAIKLTNKPSDIGRHVYLFNTTLPTNNDILTNQEVTIIPSGNTVIFENGIGFSSLTLSNESIELVGAGYYSGTTSHFNGWIVLNRTDIITNSKYGANFKYLAHLYLSITCSSGEGTVGLDTSNSTTFDGCACLEKQSDADAQHPFYASIYPSKIHNSEFTLYFPQHWAKNGGLCGNITAIPVSYTINGLYIKSRDTANGNFIKFGTTDGSYVAEIIIYNFDNLYSQNKSKFQNYFRIEEVGQSPFTIPVTGGKVTFTLNGLSWQTIEGKYSLSNGGTLYDADTTGTSNTVIVTIPTNTTTSNVSNGDIILYNNINNTELYKVSYNQNKRSATPTGNTYTSSGFKVGIGGTIKYFVIGYAYYSSSYPSYYRLTDGYNITIQCTSVTGSYETGYTLEAKVSSLGSKTNGTLTFEIKNSNDSWETACTTSFAITGLSISPSSGNNFEIPYSGGTASFSTTGYNPSYMKFYVNDSAVTPTTAGTNPNYTYSILLSNTQVTGGGTVTAKYGGTNISNCTYSISGRTITPSSNNYIGNKFYVSKNGDTVTFTATGYEPNYISAGRLIGTSYQDVTPYTSGTVSGLTISIPIPNTASTVSGLTYVYYGNGSNKELISGSQIEIQYAGISLSGSANVNSSGGSVQFTYEGYSYTGFTAQYRRSSSDSWHTVNPITSSANYFLYVPIPKNTGSNTTNGEIEIRYKSKVVCSTGFTQDKYTSITPQQTTFVVPATGGTVTYDYEGFDGSQFIAKYKTSSSANFSPTTCTANTSTCTLVITIPKNESGIDITSGMVGVSLINASATIIVSTGYRQDCVKDISPSSGTTLSTLSATGASFTFHVTGYTPDALVITDSNGGSLTSGISGNAITVRVPDNNKSNLSGVFTIKYGVNTQIATYNYTQTGSNKQFFNIKEETNLVPQSANTNYSFVRYGSNFSIQQSNPVVLKDEWTGNTASNNYDYILRFNTTYDPGIFTYDNSGTPDPVFSFNKNDVSTSAITGDARNYDTTDVYVPLKRHTMFIEGTPLNTGTFTITVPGPEQITLFLLQFLGMAHQQ